MVTEIVTPRIVPLEAPYDPAVAEQLASMMPPGVPPIALFRTFAKNLPMARAMAGWGRYELSRSLSLSMRDRELVIDRTCARCGCDYEFGVHVAFFAERVGLGAAQVASLAQGSADDDCWVEDRDRLLIRAVDALHDECDIDDELWAALAAEFSEANLLDLIFLCGWYHAISFAARAARVPLESGAPTLAALA
jgi:alkylhydroperoxidase family enzyme